MKKKNRKNNPFFFLILISPLIFFVFIFSQKASADDYQFRESYVEVKEENIYPLFVPLTGKEEEREENLGQIKIIDEYKIAGIEENEFAYSLPELGRGFKGIELEIEADQPIFKKENFQVSFSLFESLKSLLGFEVAPEYRLEKEVSRTDRIKSSLSLPNLLIETRYSQSETKLIGNTQSIKQEIILSNQSGQPLVITLLVKNEIKAEEIFWNGKYHLIEETPQELDASDKVAFFNDFAENKRNIFFYDAAEISAGFLSELWIQKENGRNYIILSLNLDISPYSSQTISPQLTAFDFPFSLNPESLRNNSGVKFNYKITDNGVKEEIVLNERPTQNDFSLLFDLNSRDFSMKKRTDGAWYFYAKEDRSFNFPLFFIPLPFMTDALGAYTEAVEINHLIKGGKEYLEVAPNADWLNESRRAYPVIIDPSFEVAEEEQEIIEERDFNSKTFRNPDGSFTWSGWAGPVHYQDENNQWQEIDTSIKISSDQDYAFEVRTNLQKAYFKKDLTEEFFHKTEIQGASIYQGLAKERWRFCSLSQASQAEVKNNTITYPSICQGIDLRYTVTPQRIVEEYIVHNSQAAIGISSFPQILKTEGGYFTDGKIENSGITLWEIEDGESFLNDLNQISFISNQTQAVVLLIPKPRMYELNESGMASTNLVNDDIELVLSDQAGMVILEKKIGQQGKEWLSSPERNYPLAIDAVTVNEQVGASLDDAYQLPGGGIDKTGDYTRNGYSGSNYYYAGYRFQTVNIPEDSNVTSATFQGYEHLGGGNSGPVIDLRLYLHDTGDCANFNTSGPADRSGSLTSASLNWDVTRTYGSAWHTSGNASAVIEEVTNATAWNANNDMCVIIKGDVAALEYINFRANDYDGTNEAKLNLTFTKPNGETCSTGTDCTSGYCANGYCCNTACGGNCDRCNVTPGTCTNVDADCTGNCDVCTSGNCAASAGLCTGNCDQCTGSGTAYNCSALASLCTGNCDQCTGSGTAYNCSALASLCTGNCDVCNGSGTAWNCAADQDLCAACKDCDYVSATNYTCANVTNNTEDNVGTNTCTGTCVACQSGSCSWATAGTDPDADCGATNCYTGNCGGSSTCQVYSGGEEGTCAACTGCTDADSACDNLTNNQEDNTGSNLCTGTCIACQAGSCGSATVDTDPDADCSATNCYTGNCDGASACKIYSGGEEGTCAVCYGCTDADSTCDVYTNNTQDSTGSNLCNGTCAACQAGACGSATVDTDPGSQCSATNCYTGNCDGAGACKIYTGGEEGTCAACTGCTDADSACDNLTNNTEDNTGSNLCTGTCYACQSGACSWATAGTDPDADCTATDCYTGNCGGGSTCQIYSGGEEGTCAVCYGCTDADSTCDVYTNNTQDSTGSNLCNSTCAACQSAACGNATAGTDPGSQCATGSWACDGLCRLIRNSGNCSGAGACGVNDETSNCGANTACSSGSCAATNYCNATWAYGTCTGDNCYNTGGSTYYCKGSCDGSNNCDYAANCDAVPQVSNVSLNSGSNISLNENTTTSVNITGQVVDSDGCSNVTSITALAYRSAVSSTCSADDNNCYRNLSCSTSCSGTTISATCAASLWFHADPTDSGTYSAQYWLGSIAATDATSALKTGVSGTTTELNTLLALQVPASIAYGTVNPGSNTAANQATGVTATGNAAINSSVKGTAMTSAASGGTLLVSKQKYGLSDVAYGSLTYTLSASDAALDLDCAKPTSHPSSVIDIIYWGLGVDTGTPYGIDYSGTNTLTPAPG